MPQQKIKVSVIKYSLCTQMIVYIMYRYVPVPVIDIHVPVKCLEGHE